VKLAPMKQEPNTFCAPAYNGKFWRTGMATAGRPTGGRRPARRRRRAAAQARLSLPAKPVLAEQMSVRAGTPSGAWTCFLSLALVILLLILGVLATVFVWGSGSLT
jgi:hypothetical protein